MTMTLGEQADMALRIVAESNEDIAYDTETSGLDWRVNQPVGYVITLDAIQNVYIPVRHAAGGNLMDANCPPLATAEQDSPTHRFERELAKAFQARRDAKRPGRIIGHNLKFDMHFTAKHGGYLGRNCEDTSLTEAMLDEFCRSFSLDNCAKAHKVTAKLGQEMYDHLAKLFGGPADKKQMQHFWRTAGDDPVAVDYAKGDGITTLELARAQRLKIAEEEMQLIHEVESDLIWTVFKIEHRGIKVDMARFERLYDEVNALIKQAETMLPSGLNVRSGPQLKAFFEAAKRTDWPTTELGNPSFTEKWLKSHDEGKAIIQLRKFTNLKNSFMNPLRDDHVYKGRVHANLNQLKADDLGTISGRFSCSGPNLQQVPKRDKQLGPLFRSLFVPDEGYEFFESDYSQCEPRLYAHYSKDEALVNGYNQVPFRDAHQVVADLLHVRRDPEAKRMNMGIFTGMGVDAFEGHMQWEGQFVDENGKDIAEDTDAGTVNAVRKAQYMYDKWFQQFTSIKEFQDLAKRAFRQRMYVKTLLGRRCRLDSPRFAYRAVSRIIQGGNADIIKYKMREIDMFLEAQNWGTELLMTVHDSLNGQTPINEQWQWAEVERIACDVQSAPFKLRVPFVMDTGHGQSWKEATYGVSA